MLVAVVDPCPSLCCAKLAAWALTVEDRDQLASVGLAAFRTGRRLLLQVIVLGHGSLDLEPHATRRALEFIDSHHSTSRTRRQLWPRPRSCSCPPTTSPGRHPTTSHMARRHRPSGGPGQFLCAVAPRRQWRSRSAPIQAGAPRVSDVHVRPPSDRSPVAPVAPCSTAMPIRLTSKTALHSTPGRVTIVALPLTPGGTEYNGNRSNHARDS